MKKIFFATIVAALFAACDTENLNPSKQTMSASGIATLRFDYRLGGGDMYTRSDAGWSTFYSEILSGELVEPRFSLYFTPIGGSSQKAINISSTWRSKEKFNIPTGRYRITGSSVVNSKGYIKCYCTLTFDEERDITGAEDHLFLNARYGSYLLYAQQATTQKVTNCGSKGEEPFFALRDDYYYAFADGPLTDHTAGAANVIRLYNPDGSTTDIATNPHPFQVGRYYVLAGRGQTFGFDAQEMEQGN